VTSPPSQPISGEAVSRADRSWALFEHGLLVFERRLAPTGPFRLLLSHAQLCTARQCDCRDVTLTAVGFDVGTDFSGLGLSSSEVRSMLDGPSAMHALLDIDLGILRPDEHEGRAPLSSDWVDYVQSHVDGELLEELHERWLRAKGFRRREPRAVDFSALEPGELVAWHELHPDDRRDFYLDEDAVFLANEFYCVNPDCDCAEATIDFAELLEKKRASSIGYVRIRLPDTEVIELIGPRSRLERLWSAFRDRHKSTGDRLLARKRRLAEGARLRPDARLDQPSAPTQRIGRNDPCPCGSGNKYKRCCAS
jgi:hypothetical protein